MSTRLARLRLTCYRLISKRTLYQGDQKLRDYVSKPPVKKQEAAWTRLAHKIQDLDLKTDFSKEKHLEQLRTVYDPKDAITKLEDELQEEIASSLDASSKNTIALSFNEIRALARESRRDLIIHRQAAGFTFQNHRIVEEEFPLPPKIDIIPGAGLSS